MSNNPLQGHIRLYAAGGCGINIASFFEPAAGKQEPGHSIPHPVYIDTSMSNIRDGINKEHTFIIEGVDGSGKVRRENYQEITKNVKSLLTEFKPMDFNVVVFSASGGSGSVFGPLIIGELLSRGLPVVAVVVGSDESNIAAHNTLNTLKSLEAIATKHELPVVMYYEHNEPGLKRSDIDISCRHLISALSILASRQNSEMDSKDIQNWVQYNKTTSVPPRLSLVEVYHSNEEADQATQPVSVASLLESPDSPSIKVAPEYHCAGYPRNPGNGFKLTHYVITVAGVPVLARKIQERINELEQLKASRVLHDSLVESRDDTTTEGLVL